MAAEAIANALIVILGTAKTIQFIESATGAVRDAPQEIRHLHNLCHLLEVSLSRVQQGLEQRRRQQMYIRPLGAFQPQPEYYHALADAVTAVQKDVHDLEMRIPKDIARSSVWSSLKKSRAVKELQCELSSNHEALSRIERNIPLLNLATTELWCYEQVQYVDGDQEFLEGLRGLIKELGGARSTIAKHASKPDAFEHLRSSAFRVANSLAIQTISSTTGSIIDTTASETLSGLEVPSISSLPPEEQLDRYVEALETARLAQDQRFPDAAAMLFAQALALHTQLVAATAIPPDFLEEVRLESEYITILLSCVSRGDEDAGRARIETLASEIDEFAYSASADMGVVIGALEEVGKLFYEVGELDLAVKYLRRALMDGDLLISDSEDRDDEAIQRLSRMIYKAYEASANVVEQKAFRRYIKDHTGFDPVTDLPDLEATLRWCRANGFPVDARGTLEGLRNGKGETALHAAVLDPDIAEGVLRQLASDKTVLDAKDKDELTPLLVAVEQSCTEAVKVLLEEGASLDHRKPFRDLEETVLHVCRDSTILKLLLEKVGIRRPSIPHPSDPALTILSPTSTRPLHIDSQNTYGGTALHNACDRVDYKAVELLLRFGADPNALTLSGETPLIAVSHKKVSHKAVTRRIVEELVMHGAEPGVTDEAGRTASDGLLRRGFDRVQVEMMLLGKRRKSSSSHVRY